MKHDLIMPGMDGVPHHFLDLLRGEVKHDVHDGLVREFAKPGDGIKRDVLNHSALHRIVSMNL